MSQPKVLVIGDYCTDVFIYGECKRLSPEAPVPVFNPIEKIENPGMAGGIADILSYYDCQVDLICNTDKITKTRYVDKKTDHYFLRVDSDDKVKYPLTKHEVANMGISDYDFVILSDYCKGFLTESMLQEISYWAKLSFIDTKKKIDNCWIDAFSFIKVNEKEYENSKIFLCDKDNVIVTLGENGARHNGIIFPLVNQQKIFELSAAGDVFHASFAFSYYLTKNIVKSIEFANLASSWHVIHRGTNFPAKKFDWKRYIE